MAMLWLIALWVKSCSCEHLHTSVFPAGHRGLQNYFGLQFRISRSLQGWMPHSAVLSGQGSQLFWSTFMLIEWETTKSFGCIT
ncbi:hypothetical protein M758_2G137600 [Ceratodon purpureus]|uniref:Secreted protein n=1 Tax=Ceratodon purpureus TaxID=3225 RepID=A0A8T0IXP7_CERPU|nr:hypothetical protein KC19_2G143700 [Ceratodon purpureus]KAG0626609.1 hypothetical protein M758_2G137600 [Ceratodon purpureus]